MREIKFRGMTNKRDESEWTYGDLLHYNDEYFINVFETEFGERAYMERVIKKSICQFTGLHDKNGKEIYEGDIIRFTYEKDFRISLEDSETRIVNKAFEVKWWETQYNIIKSNEVRYEVIGNIYENHELLEATK